MRAKLDPWSKDSSRPVTSPCVTPSTATSHRARSSAPRSRSTGGPRRWSTYGAGTATENELIRRVDPSHRSIGRLFHAEIAVPLELDFHIGLPSDVPESRIAEIDGFTPLQMARHMNVMPTGMVLAYLWPRSLVARTMGNPRLHSPADINRPDYRRVEWPAGNGIGTVRSIAKAYAVFASGGRELALRPETLRALEEPTPSPSGGTRDMILKVETRFSMGFMKPFPSFRFGSSARAYGRSAWGDRSASPTRTLVSASRMPRIDMASTCGTTRARSRFETWRSPASEDCW
jgi:hypothetical protein